jgi:hypothetical protein
MGGRAGDEGGVSGYDRPVDVGLRFVGDGKEMNHESKRETMISKEQIDRCISEFAIDAAISFAKARDLERSLEAMTYAPDQNYNPARREELLEAYREARYEAESRAFILALLKQEQQSRPFS